MSKCEVHDESYHKTINNHHTQSHTSHWHFHCFLHCEETGSEYQWEAANSSKAKISEIYAV